MSEEVIGVDRIAAYTSATTIEDAVAEAGWQIANWYAESGRQDAPEHTHAVYLYNAAQDQGYLAMDMDIDGSFETGMIFPGLSIDEFHDHFVLYSDYWV